MARTVILAGTLVVVGIVLTGLCAVQLGVARAAAKWPSARPPLVGRGLSLAGIVLGVLSAAAAGGLAAALIPVEGALWLGGVAAGAVAVAAAGAAAAVKLASQVELKALISTPSPAYVAIASRDQSPPAITARGENVAPMPRSQPATGSAPGASANAEYGIDRLPSSRGVLQDTGRDRRATGHADAATGAAAGAWGRAGGGEYGRVAYGGDVPASAGACASDAAVPVGAEPGWVYQDAEGEYLLVVGAEGGGAAFTGGMPDGPAAPGGAERRLVRLDDFSLVAPGAASMPLTLVGSIEIAVWPLE